MKIIGTSKMATNNKVTLIEPVPQKLNIAIGELLAFLESSTGDIIIKKLSDIEMKEVEK